jgi:hypothetical protein
VFGFSMAFLPRERYGFPNAKSPCVKVQRRP